MKNGNIPRRAIITISLSYVSAGVGALLVLIATGLQKPASDVASAFGSSLLALGVISFASDHFLRSAMLKDMLRTFQLKESLYRSGIVRLDLWSNLDWTKRLSRSNEVTVVALRPRDWLMAAWPNVLKGAKVSGTAIHLYVPDPTSAQDIATRLAINTASYVTEINEVVGKVQNDWTRERDVRRSLAAGSSIHIMYLPEDPGHSVTANDKHIFLSLEPFHPSGDNTQVIVAQFRRSDVPARNLSWLTNGLADLNDRKLPPVWASESTVKVGRTE